MPERPDPPGSGLFVAHDLAKQIITPATSTWWKSPFPPVSSRGTSWRSPASRSVTFF